MQDPEDRSVTQIRDAQAQDQPALLALRNHYIANSFATFDEQAMRIDAITSWMARFAVAGPYKLLVAVRAQRLLGFASSQRYREHPAFDQTVETSIYLAPYATRQGLGVRLYGALFDHLAAQNLHRAVVGIALPNDASVALHTRMGFKPVGVFSEYARKNGRYISSMWMERALG